jgi:ELWxxDGT repeat protein
VTSSRSRVSVGLLVLVALVSSDRSPARAAGQAPVAEFVAEIRSGPGSSAPIGFKVFKDALYFSANDGVNGDELWRLDANGVATLVADIFPGTCDVFGQIVPCSSGPRQLTVAGDVLYFVAGRQAEGRELWRYDGITPPALAANIKPGAATSFPSELTAFGNDVVFTADDGTGAELFAFGPSDVVPRRFDIYPDDPSCDPGGGGCGSEPYGLTVYNGTLYFTAGDPVVGFELLGFDGSTVRLVSDLLPGPGSSGPQGITGLGNRLVFGAFDSNQYRLFSYDIGTGVGGKISDIVVNDTRLRPATRFASLNGAVYLPANDGTSGEELWKTDGTAAGTQLVADLNTGAAHSLPRLLTVFNGELYFKATDATVGDEIRATNGTNVRLLTDLYPGPLGSLFNAPAVLGNFLLFEARSAIFGLNPWFTDGTAGMTDIVRQADGTLIYPAGSAIDDPGFTFFNGALYFAATDGVRGIELWRVALTARAPTTTTLTSSLNPSTFGQQVTFTATVSGASPSESVNFFDNGTLLGSATLVSAVASVSLTTLGVGSHTITAEYTGDADDAPSTSTPLVQVVDPVSTATTLGSSPNPSFISGVVEFTAMVTPGSPTGSIVFAEGGVTLATVTLAGNLASFQTSTLTAGSHTINAVYSGDTNYAGSTSNAVVQIVNNVQAPPVANSQSVTTPEDTPKLIVLGASDANNDPLTFIVVTQPGFGTLTGQAPNLIYTPNANYFGPDSFTFKAYDGTADSNIATVSITVTPVNDPPVAVNDSYITAEDTALIVPAPGVLGNDSDVEGSILAAILVSGPLHGVLTLSANGSFVYTPSLNFNGADGFTYRATDGSLTSGVVTAVIAVNAVNDPPVAANDVYSTEVDTPLTIAAPGVLGNDSDVEGPLTAAVVTGPVNGTLTLNANGSFTYTPAANFTGTDTFSYAASDGAATSAPATVTLTVTANNDIKWRVTGNLGSRRRFHTATLLANGKVLVTGGYGSGNGVLDSAEIYDPSTETWSATGKLGSRRAFHTGTLLPNGQVLVAGGENANFQLNSAEVWDPVTGSWNDTGSLGTVHSRHTALLLPIGVLVVGGYNAIGSSTSAELYNLATRTWSATGSLSVGRNFHTATLLSTGQVLVAGGYGNNGAVNSAEIYNPAFGTWSLTGSLLTSRTGHTATLLSNGDVLVAGGGNNGGTIANTELYYVSTGAWVPMGNLNAARISHTGTRLLNGKVLVAGGSDPAGTSVTSAELFDPATGQWSVTASLNAARASHTATLLQNGKVLAVGGYGNGTLAGAELYGPLIGSVGGTWTLSGSLNDRRLYHTATLLANGKVLVAGGLGNGNPIKSTELYDPASGNWSATGNLTERRSRHTATLLPDGRVLVAGGFAANSVALKSAEIYDPATGAWSSTGSLITARGTHAATLLADGKVLVVGGAIGSAELYDPTTGTWTATGSPITHRSDVRAVRLPNGKVLIAGGSVAVGVSTNTCELYDPATGTWSVTGNLTVGRRSHTTTLLPNGKVLAAGGVSVNAAINEAELYDPATGTWTATGTLTTGRQDHTAVLLPTGKVLVAAGLRVLGNAELYDPATGSWSATGSLIGPRVYHTTTLLTNGTVLAAGGNAEFGSLTSSEVYRP